VLVSLSAKRETPYVTVVSLSAKRETPVPVTIRGTKAYVILVCARDYSATSLF
jgi:hypothetical protein